MDLKEPRPKKQNKMKISLPLPIIENSEGEIFKFTGYFNGFSVIIKDKDEMIKVNSMGCFGKGNLSRGYPLFETPKQDVEILRRRLFNQRNKFKVDSESKLLKKIIVVPDSDSENDDYFINLKPEYQIDQSCLKETLTLLLEEAFFLSFCVRCLNIYKQEKLLSEEEAWEIFKNTDQYFIQNYLVYHYFRSKNWIVKSGIKFGGDFLLYKEGPSFYHASYLVIIDVLNCKTLQRKEDMCRRTMDVRNILGLNRLCETVGKDLLISQILWPEELNEASSEDVPKFFLNETILRRWIPTQNRELLES